MILWTIQYEGAWQRAQKSGLLRADGRRHWRSSREAYRWIGREMRRRIGEPPLGVRCPVWAWFQYQNERSRRPDLRRLAHAPSGTRAVLIEFDIAEDQVLLSDFDLWHYVLNQWYLPQTAQEATDILEDAAVTVECDRQTREASWQSIFDLDWSLTDISVPRREKSIQATLWQVPLSSVRSAKPFRAR